MGVWWCRLARLAVLLWAGAAPAQPAPAPHEVPVVPLNAAAHALPLDGKIGVFVDDGGQVGIEEVHGPRGDSMFSVPAGVIKVGLDPRPHWFKIRFEQQTPTGDWVLALSTLNVRDLRLYGPYDETGSASLAPAVVTGISQPFASRGLGNERFAFRIETPGPGVYTIYLRAQSALPQNYSITMWDLGAFTMAQQDARLFDGIRYGVIFGLMVYAMLMYSTFRDPIYMYFLVAAAWALLTLALLNGHVARYVFPDLPALAERVRIVVPAVWVSFSVLFGYRFLNMPRRAPRFGWAALALSALAAIVAVVAMAGELVTTSLATAVLAACGLLLVPGATRPSRQYGFNIAGWYMVASCLILLTVLVMMGMVWLVLPPWVVTEKYVQLAIIGQAVLFSIALGQRLPRMWLQQGQLHDRAAELAKAAETDPLTRIANRAGLARRALDLLEPAARRSLMILDLDHFKPINDQFGHDVGDEVLMRVARRLERLVSPRGLVARLGGDEFAVLMSDLHEREELAVFAQRVIDSIGAPIEMRGKAHQVGVSIGIARFPENGDDLSRLMRRADLALYRVKRRGRNGYAYFDDLPPDTSTFASL